ncbi:hypothetical protein MY4824_008154 [Beauveria thailandica]
MHITLSHANPTLDEENDDDYRVRFDTWIKAHLAVDGENRHSSEGLTFHGCRIAPSPGVTLHHAIAPYLKVSFLITADPENPVDFSATCFPTPAGSSRDADAN